MTKIYTKNTWIDEVLGGGGTPLYDIDGGSIGNNVAIEQVETVSQAGSDFNASRMNNLENGVDDIDDRVVSGWNSLENVTLTYSSADDPTYVISSDVDLTSILSVGMKLWFQNDGGDVYGFVTAIGAWSGSAQLITLYGGTDYDVANSAITAPYYSTQKAPFGFPLDHDVWDIVVDSTTTYVKTSPTASTWYNAMDAGNLPSIDIPVGAWSDVYYELYMYATRAGATSVNMFCTLSVDAGGAITEDKKWTSGVGTGGASGTLIPQVAANKRNPMILTTKDTFYLNIKTNTGADNINVVGASITTKLRAVCAYL